MLLCAGILYKVFGISDEFIISRTFAHDKLLGAENNILEKWPEYFETIAGRKNISIIFRFLKKCVKLKTMITLSEELKDLVFLKQKKNWLGTTKTFLEMENGLGPLKDNKKKVKYIFGKELLEVGAAYRVKYNIYNCNLGFSKSFSNHTILLNKNDYFFVDSVRFKSEKDPYRYSPECHRHIWPIYKVNIMKSNKFEELEIDGRRFTCFHLSKTDFFKLDKKISYIGWMDNTHKTNLTQVKHLFDKL